MVYGVVDWVGKRISPGISLEGGFTLLSLMFIVMIISCVIMLTVQGSVETKERKIENLLEELQSLQADNSASENSLNNMYSLEDIYSIATG